MSVFSTYPRLRPTAGLVAFAGVVVATAVIGSLASMSAASEYQMLRLPPFAPPSWLFGPVWTVLYATIAVSGWLVWRRSGLAGARVPLGVFGVQLVLNAAWTPLFFAAGRYGLALVDIAALFGCIATLIVMFGRKHRVAGLLLVPYLAWVGFATALNTGIWLLNG